MGFSTALPTIVWTCVAVGASAALVIFAGFAATFYRARKYAKDLSCSIAPDGGYARTSPAYGEKPDKPAPPPSSTYQGDGAETVSTEYSAGAQKDYGADAPKADYGADAPKDEGYGQGEALPPAVVAQACGLYERERGAPPSSDADALALLRESVSAELSTESCASKSEVQEAARAYSASYGAGRPLGGAGYSERERLEQLKAGLDGALVIVAPHTPAPIPAPPALALPPPPAGTSASSANVAGVQGGDYKGESSCEA